MPELRQLKRKAAMSLEIYNTTRREIPQKKLEAIMESVIEAEGYVVGSVIAVFCGDRMIQRINREFLGHDYPTDTITFRYGSEKAIDGEFYISLDVVGKNARRFKTGFENELFRVTIHAALHLAGYDNKHAGTKTAMREKEDYHLSQLSF